MSETETTARRRRAALSAVSFSVDLARTICLRISSGETQLALCEEEGMPSRGTLFRWARDRPKFAADLARAKAAAGRAAKGGYPSRFCAETAGEFFDRLCEGESLTAICRDPAMPSFSTFYGWRRQFPEFRELMETAREVQAERFFAMGWDIAEAVTPATAQATKVKLHHLRWTAGRLAPTKYGNTRPVEIERPPPVQTLLIRHFKLETREDGAVRVVGYTPNPRTMLPERTSEGAWEQPPGAEEPARIAGVGQPAARAASEVDPEDPEGWL